MQRKAFMHILLTSILLASAATSPTSIPLAKENGLQQKLMKEIEQEAGAVTFQPPSHWMLADPKALPGNVRIMVVGKGNGEYPPSLNLWSEHFVGNLKQYLRIVKAINDKKGDDWKDLGVIRTEAGDASLSQVDSKTKWGTERLMHVILVRDNRVYILTAAALKDEFPKYYKDFFNAFRSLKFNKDVFEMVPNVSKRVALQNAIQQLKFEWEDYAQRAERNTTLSFDDDAPRRLFESADFQEKYWNAFKTYLNKDFADMPSTWQVHVLATAQRELLNVTSSKN